MKNEYKVLGGYLTIDIEKIVTKYLNDGWELVGGVCFGHNGYYYQSVKRIIKDGENDLKK